MFIQLVCVILFGVTQCNNVLMFGVMVFLAIELCFDIYWIGFWWKVLLSTIFIFLI